MDLNGKRIAILATHGFEQSELEVPRDRLKKAGATVDVVSLASGEIKGRFFYDPFEEVGAMNRLRHAKIAAPPVRDH